MRRQSFSRPNLRSLRFPSLVEFGVVGYRLPAVGTAGNAGFDPAASEGSAEAVAVITLRAGNRIAAPR